MKKYFKLLRIKNYIKNALMVIPMVFGKCLFDFDLIPKMIWGFISFCALSSAIYVFNDLCDIERDKIHPVKKNRPIANGSISKNKATAIMVALIITCIATNFMACGGTVKAWLLLAAYLVQNILYSLKLKRIPVVDVVVLALGFLIRVFYGSAILGISVSNWLYLTIIAISFYIGFGKRRNELALLDGHETRAVLTHYTYDFLDKNMYVCAALTIVFYSLWSVDSTTIQNLGNNYMVWTVPLIILICITYSLSVERCKTDDPIDIIFQNKILILLIAIYATSMVVIIY